MVKRRADELIRNFILNDRRSLLVTGARQVGKTFSVRKVGKECFDNVVEINFVEQPDAIELFSEQKGAKDLLLRLSAFTKKPLVPGKTLIFFDEVQECKEMVTAIKFLVDEGSYKYVMSGSLLGVELDDLRSVPVGYMDEIEMYPLDLQEFFEAIGIGADVISHLRTCFEEKKPVDEFIHKRMSEAVRLYLIVGGMPAAVQKYLDTNNLRRVYEEQSGIIRTYKRDITKYAHDHKLQIEEIYDLIPSELNAKNKRFILKELNEKARFSRYESGFLWLKDAGVAIPTYNIEEPRLPLLLSKQRNLFKLFLNDVGLLAAMYGGDIQFVMGVKMDGTLNGISFLSIGETAGLGMKATEDKFMDQFKNKNVSKLSYTKNGALADDEIDALSGATITTNAVTNGVNAGLYYISKMTEEVG